MTPTLRQIGYSHSRKPPAGPRGMLANERCCSQRQGGTLCNFAGLRPAPFTANLLEPLQQNAALYSKPIYRSREVGMPSLTTLVHEHYQSLEAQPRLGATLADLAEFERTHHLVLPHPVRQLYRRMDGLNGAVPDIQRQLQLWPLAELSRVSHRVAAYRGIPDYGPIVHTLPNAHEYLAFGDGMIWSHVLAFRLNEQAGSVVWICGAHYAEVAPDFEEFWRRYLKDPDSVLWPTNDQIIAPAVKRALLQTKA